MTKCMIYNWQLSPAEPFAWETQKYTGAVRFPLLDMHQAIHLGMLTAGEITGTAAGRVSVFRSGVFYLTAPWEIHGAMSTETGFELQMLTINPDVLFSALPRCRNAFQSFFLLTPDTRSRLLANAKQQPAFQRLFRKLEHIRKKSGPYAKTRQWLAAETFLVDFLEALAPPEPEGGCGKNTGYGKLLPALRELHNTGKAMSAGTAAEHCSLSVDYFSHLFKQNFGVPFSVYEMNHRLNRAAEHLLQNRSSLKETAQLFGFSDKSHFCRCFRKNFGIPPGAFLREKSI